MDWDDYGEIAVALHKLYPKAPVITMSDAELIEKVISLPGFTGEKVPPSDRYPSFILNKWIIVRDGGTRTVDDSPFV